MSKKLRLKGGVVFVMGLFALVTAKPVEATPAMDVWGCSDYCSNPQDCEKGLFCAYDCTTEDGEYFRYFIYCDQF